MASEELRKWVQDALQKGATSETIASELRKAGYGDPAIRDVQEMLTNHKTSGHTRLAEGGAGKRRIPVWMILAAAILVSLGVLVWNLGSRGTRGPPTAIELTADTSEITAVSDGCSPDAEQWVFYHDCSINATMALPREWGGRHLRITFEASGTPVELPVWVQEYTTTFTGITAQEFVETDWATRGKDIPGFPVKDITRDYLLNTTTASEYRSVEDLPHGITPAAVATTLRDQFERLGKYDPEYNYYQDFVVDNYTLRGNELKVRQHKEERLKSPLPFMVLRANEEQREIPLTKEDWQIYSMDTHVIQEGDPLFLSVTFLNDLYIKGTGEDRNLFIRRIVITPIVKGK